jgi:ABC-type sugar transport system substrate-binding protein
MPATRVAVFLTDDRNDFLRMVQADALSEGQRLGLQVDVSFAGNDPIVQIQQVYASLRESGANRPRAVLVMPVNDDSLARVARASVAAGVGWVSLFRRSPYFEEIRRTHPGVPVMVASPEQTTVGTIQGRQVRALLPEGGKLLFVKGMASSSSTLERVAATEEVLRGSQVEIAGEVDGKWSEEVAAQEVERWLRLLGSFKDRRVGLIACQSDAMARGAIRARQEAGAVLGRPELARIPVIGADGLPEVGRRMVDSGELAATIVLPSPAGPALQALEQSWSRGVPTPPEILLPSTGYPDEPALASRARGR